MKNRLCLLNWDTADNVGQNADDKIAARCQKYQCDERNQKRGFERQSCAAECARNAEDERRNRAVKRVPETRRIILAD